MIDNGCSILYFLAWPKYCAKAAAFESFQAKLMFVAVAIIQVLDQAFRPSSGQALGSARDISDKL